MYIINMSEISKIFNFGESSFQIFFGELLTLNEWKGGDMKAPFWRFYCPLEKGGIVIHKGQKISLLPGKGYIIPAMTDYKCDLEISFTKVYTHFSYEILGYSFLPGIYEFKLETNDFQKLKEVREIPDEIIKPQFDLLIFKITAQGVSEIPISAIIENRIDPRIKDLVLWIRKQNRNIISNKTLAERINMTEQSMIRLFKNTMEISPQKYQQRFRLQKASSLLVYTDMPIEDIAKECGFWDRNHFSRSFRKFFNSPPVHYRKINKEQ